MKAIEIVKAWKDEEYRESLPADQRAQVPPHPSGLIEFGVPQLEDESLFGADARKCKFITKSTSTGHCTTHSPGHCK